METVHNQSLDYSNMDPKTKATLGRITRNIPRRLQNVTRIEVDTSEEEIAKAALRSNKISKEKKRDIARLLEKGAFRREEVVVDEDKVAELDRYHTAEIAKAKRSGMLADPNKDPFWVKRQAKIREHQKK